MYKRFDLLHGANKIGSLSFNGNFIFTLESNIDIETWQNHGIIPVDKKTGQCESSDLFLYINSRLPASLRNADKSEKIKYIEETELKVASDNFRFVRSQDEENPYTDLRRSKTLVGV